MKEEEKSITEAQKLSSKEIEKLVGFDQLRKSLSGIDEKKEFKGRDIEKLMNVRNKILKQKDELDKILKKYK